MIEEDLQQCIQHKSTKFLCKKNLPSYDLHSNNAPCEAKMLSHQNIAPCSIDYGSCKEDWIELHSLNSWLTKCCDVCSLRTICNEDITTSTISSSSIVILPQGCVLQSKDLTIYAHRQYNTRMKMDYEFSVPTLDTSINNVVNATYIKQYTQNTLQSLAPDLQRIEDRIAAQKESEAKHITISSHDVHQYIVTYLLLVSAIAALVVVVGRKRCRPCATKKRADLTNEQRHDDIELQAYNQHRTTGAISSSQNDVYRPEIEPETSRSRRNLTEGTKNIAFSFD